MSKVPANSKAPAKSKKVLPQIGSFFADDAVIVTKEGLNSLQEELNNLKTVRRRQVAERLKEAISFGDLSENSEYEEAKNEQAFVEGRVLELEGMIKNAAVVDEKQHSKNIVEIGTKVLLCPVDAKKDEQEWTIVGSTESDPFNGRISNEAPLGVALMGSKVGDIIDVITPTAIDKYEVLKLS